MGGFKHSHTAGPLFSCSNLTGSTVIIIQPTSNLGPETPEGKNQPIPLPMPTSPSEPQSLTSAASPEDVDPAEAAPESK